MEEISNTSYIFASAIKELQLTEIRTFAVLITDAPSNGKLSLPVATPVILSCAATQRLKNEKKLVEVITNRSLYRR